MAVREKSYDLTFTSGFYNCWIINKVTKLYYLMPKPQVRHWCHIVSRSKLMTHIVCFGANKPYKFVFWVRYLEV